MAYLVFYSGDDTEVVQSQCDQPHSPGAVLAKTFSFPLLGTHRKHCSSITSTYRESHAFSPINDCQGVQNKSFNAISFVCRRCTLPVEIKRHQSRQEDCMILFWRREALSHFS